MFASAAEHEWMKAGREQGGKDTHNHNNEILLKDEESEWNLKNNTDWPFSELQRCLCDYQGYYIVIWFRTS